MRRQSRQDVRIYDAKDPLTLEVIQNLYATPQKKKEIANRFNIPLEVVCKIYKVHCRGQEKFLDQYNEQKVVLQEHVEDKLDEVEYPEMPEVTFETVVEEKSGKDDYFNISRDEFFARQRKGIEAAKAAGVHMGRPRAVMPEEFAEVYNEWKAGQITAVSAMKKLNLKRSTFYRFVQQYEKDIKTAEVINPLKEEETEMGRKNKIKYRKHAPLTEEMVVAMLVDAEDGMTATEVAKKYGISATTVSNYAKSFGITMTKGKGGVKKSTPIVDKSTDKVDVPGSTVVVQPKKEEIVPPTLAMKKIKFSKVVRVGLINDRHDMPVDEYIFNDVPTSKLFDYDWYDQIAYDWLSRHVSSGDNIVVYCTGLTPAVTSVQKQCERLNIPLTFAHFNNDTRDYCYQKITGVDVILDEDGIEAVFKPNFARIYGNAEFVNLVECSLDSIETAKKFYGIQCQEFNSRNDRIGVLSTSLVDCFDVIWKVYPMYVKQSLMNTQKRIGVFINEYNIREDGYIEPGRSISKHYNYK